MCRGVSARFGCSAAIRRQALLSWPIARTSSTGVPVGPRELTGAVYVDGPG